MSKITKSNSDLNKDIGIDDNATSTAITIDSSENVGIGTDAPSAKLHVSGGADSTIRNTATSGSSWFVGSNIYSYILHNESNTPMVFTTNGTERMRIDSAGRVTTPYQLHWHGGLTNTSGAGIATSASTRTSRGGLNFATDRVTVPVAGVYSIHFNTISDDSTGRVDAKIKLNGVNILEMLCDVTTGYHYKSGSLDVLLAANDYIQFENDDWYDDTSTSTTWKSASVTLIG